MDKRKRWKRRYRRERVKIWKYVLCLVSAAAAVLLIKCLIPYLCIRKNVTMQAGG